MLILFIMCIFLVNACWISIIGFISYSIRNKIISSAAKILLNRFHALNYLLITIIMKNVLKKNCCWLQRRQFKLKRKKLIS